MGKKISLLVNCKIGHFKYCADDLGLNSKNVNVPPDASTWEWHEESQKGINSSNQHSLCEKEPQG